MSDLQWFARRLALAVVATWALVTVTFLLVVLTGDANEAAVEYAVASELAKEGASAEEIEAAAEAAVEQYRTARNLDVPVHERYVDWMVNVATLDLGYAFTYPQPVTSLLAERLLVTGAYVVPGMVLAVAGGVAIGTYSAFGRRPLLGRAATVGTYATFGVPNFWIAVVATALVFYHFNVPWLVGYDLERSVLSPYNRKRLVLPALLIGTGLIAEQARYVRAELLERDGRTFVTVVRSKGADEPRVARHVLRAATLPLFSLTLSTLLGVLVVNVFVIEYVLELPGFGLLSYNAILDRDLPVIVGMTLVTGGVGIVGSLVGDLVVRIADPRVGDDDE